jgi:histone acetyltransferase
MEGEDAFKFEVIHNDGTQDNMERLVKLKNIFRKQLPKMPGEYIVRLVFDRKHQSMVISRGPVIIGGCCFRYFEGQSFAEIAFLAITYSEQVKGFGTILMNRLKNFVKESRIRFFLTYADNFALGYFQKQGFTTQVEQIIPERVWKGYIKDYDGGTLMACKLDPDIDYSVISSSTAAHLERVNRLIDEISPSGVVRDPPQALLADEHCTPNDVAGLAEVHYNESEDRTIEEEEKDAKSACFNFIIESMLNNSAAWPFKEPVGIDLAPDYYEIIKDPIDLKTMRDKVRRGGYADVGEFLSDIERMFLNARTYNKKDTVYYKMADKLEDSVRAFLDILRTAS